MKGAFLDRDGTLIDVVRDEETGAISVAFHPDHLRFLPGAVEGLRMLRDAGFVLGIATNQPGPAKRQFSAEAVARTNGALVDRLAAEGIVIAGVEVCMHHPSVSSPCGCRKPMPGLVNQLVERLGVERAASWMIGDSASDIEAGRAAGVKTGLVFASNRCELCPLREGIGALTRAATPDVHGATLAEIARGIVSA